MYLGYWRMDKVWNACVLSQHVGQWYSTSTLVWARSSSVRTLKLPDSSPSSKTNAGCFFSLFLSLAELHDVHTRFSLVTMLTSRLMLFNRMTSLQAYRSKSSLKASRSILSQCIRISPCEFRSFEITNTKNCTSIDFEILAPSSKTNAGTQSVEIPWSTTEAEPAYPCVYCWSCNQNTFNYYIVHVF
jgi:hypothetical protein